MGIVNYDSAGSSSRSGNTVNRRYDHQSDGLPAHYSTDFDNSKHKEFSQSSTILFTGHTTYFTSIAIHMVISIESNDPKSFTLTIQRENCSMACGTTWSKLFMEALHTMHITVNINSKRDTIETIVTDGACKTLGMVRFASGTENLDEKKEWDWCKASPWSTSGASMSLELLGSVTVKMR